MDAHVIYADPDPDRREGTVAELRERTGLAVTGYGTVDATLAALDPAEVDCVVTTYDLGDGTATELVRAIRERVPDAMVVLYTAKSYGELDLDPDLIVEYVDRTGPDATAMLARLVENAVALRPQTAYPVPEDEADRVDVLDRYLIDDPGTAAALDRLATMATAAFDVDRSGVGLIDERTQMFVACIGVDFTTLDREDTICTYAMLEEDVTIINDVAADPRFAEVETLAANRIRSYASANVTTPDGHVIGAFCLFGDEPGAFGDRVREYLPLFAEEAMEQLELRRRLTEAADDPAIPAIGRAGDE